MTLISQTAVRFFVELARISNTESWATPGLLSQNAGVRRGLCSSKLLQWSLQRGWFALNYIFGVCFLKLDLMFYRLALNSLGSRE